VALRPVRHLRAEDFAARVLPFLMRDESRNNLMLGILMTLLGRSHLYERPLMALVERDSAVVAAMLMTPPFSNAIVSDFESRGESDAGVAEAVAGTLLESFTGVRGLVANVPVAELVAEACARRTGGVARRRTSLGVFMAEHVVAPSQPVGRSRAATVADRALMRDWYEAFSAEAHQETPTDAALRQIEDRLRRDGSGIDLWEAEGRIVSMCAFAESTPNGARIGPVYTPPEHRRRGFAGALVSDTTQRLLARGRRFCFLNTDLSNPTSNHIYSAIGYEQISVAEEWRFDPNPDSAPARASAH
jgi:uncharacterized protein